jgi:hypothetical protein
VGKGIALYAAGFASAVGLDIYLFWRRYYWKGARARFYQLDTEHDL